MTRRRVQRTHRATRGVAGIGHSVGASRGRAPGSQPSLAPRSHSARAGPGAALTLGLQRALGNRAFTGLVQRQAPPAVATRPDLGRGDLDQMVGVLQQKLNALGESLVIDAELGPRTEAAVRRFQRRHVPPLAETGRADSATWGLLDVLAPGGVLQADGTLTPVHAPGLADPTATTPAGQDVKPVLRVGSRGPAVAELHEKLNAQGETLPVATNLADADVLEFTPDTDAAVRRFQRANRPLQDDGVAGRRTWAKLDALVPGAGLGRVQREGLEEARGQTFGGDVKYDWALEPDRRSPTRLRVRVRYHYARDPDPAKQLPNHDDVVRQLLDGIRSVWNAFKAVEVPLLIPFVLPRPSVEIEFDPVLSSPAEADHQITLSAGPGPTNASQYFIVPGEDLVHTGAHEFGHHVGLQDEYQQSAASHQRQTGKVAPVGDWEGDGTPPREVALEIGRELRRPSRSDRGDRVLAVIQGHNLTQGAFSQRVADRYRNIFGLSVVFDCNRLIDQSQSEGSMTKRRLCTQPFLYNETGLMAGEEGLGTPQVHAVEPRHVRHLSDLVQQAMGGIWLPQRR